MLAVGDHIGRPLRILPLGDSLTVGASPNGAWRPWLETLLAARGVAVEWMGLIRGNVTPGDWYQGIGGYKPADMRAALPGYTFTAVPDLVITLLGNNDAADPTATYAAMVGLLTDDPGGVYTRWPGVDALIAGPTQDYAFPSGPASYVAELAAISGHLDDVATAMIAAGHHVGRADCRAAVPSVSYTYDGVHLYPAGYALVAAAMMPALIGMGY